MAVLLVAVPLVVSAESRGAANGNTTTNSVTYAPVAAPPAAAAGAPFADSQNSVQTFAPSVASASDAEVADSDVADYDADTPMRAGKWIEVILDEQRLVAWEDGRMVMTTPVSTGTRRTPTVRGTFRIYRKYERQRMRGEDYDLPNVPYVMYFRGNFAMHGTYWHSNFGQPMSHGCVNLPTGKAAWLFEWAPRGTPVVVH
jgi:lipoprotein-anchoring transpeptidase ErfK/SrfK